jgi:hypothetical protein
MASEQYSNKISKRGDWEEVILKFDPYLKERGAGVAQSV